MYPERLLKVQSQVCLAKGYQDVHDASAGPLKPGVVGKIIEDDMTGQKPWKVQVRACVRAVSVRVCARCDLVWYPSPGQA